MKVLTKLNPVSTAGAVACLCVAVAAAVGGVWLWAGIMTAAAGSNLFAAWIGGRN